MERSKILLFVGLPLYGILPVPISHYADVGGMWEYVILYANLPTLLGLAIIADFIYPIFANRIGIDPYPDWLPPTTLVTLNVIFWVPIALLIHKLWGMRKRSKNTPKE